MMEKVRKHSVLKFIGNEAGFGNKNNSAYIELDNKFILIDCGFTIFDWLKNNIDFRVYNDIQIIVTHLHNDHAGSLSQLILYLWFVYNKKVTVISKCKNIKEYLEITGTINDAYEIKNSTKEIEFIETEHVENLDCYGFIININNKKIVYTSDTITLKPFLPYLDNCNELYVDVSKFGGVHIKFEEVKDKLQEIKNKKIDVYLMHLDDIEYIKKVNNNMFFIV